jgi:hypothetical protein
MKHDLASLINGSETSRGADFSTAKLASLAPKVAAFGAVAVGGVMTASDVEADIIYSGPLNIVVNAGNPEALFDFNGDATDDVAIQFNSGGFTSFDADGLNGAEIFANPGTSTYAQRFNFGDLIPDSAGDVGLGWMGGFYNSAIYSDPWGALQAGVNQTGPVNGFLGFTFSGFNGWMELELAADTAGRPLSITVLGWAYDNTGAAIAAGNIPEPGTAGLLALGTLAAGAVGLRRKRQIA